MEGKRTMRVISKQWSKLLRWLRHSSSILSTHSVHVVLSRLEAGHLKANITTEQLSGLNSASTTTAFKALKGKS